MPPPLSIPTAVAGRKRKLLSADNNLPFTPEAPSSPSAISSSPSSPGRDDEYAPGPSRLSTATTTRRPKRTSSGAGGGKAGETKSTTGGRISREALRKANHSLIEKRRREKINAALGELRSMVPGLGEEGGGKVGEFKLEVLERTVTHMKELQRRIAMLESALPSTSTSLSTSSNNDDYTKSPDDTNNSSAVQLEGVNGNQMEADDAPSQSATATFPLPTSKRSPFPTPSPEKPSQSLYSPDPNETEVEPNLPPPLARAHPRFSSASSSRSGTPLDSTTSAPTVASLLASAQNQNQQFGSPQQPHTRPPPPPQANNPIFLPFPAPSPTSPFLHANSSTATSSSGSTASTSSTIGPVDPSPFLAPLPNVSLFGGIFNLDSGNVSPTDTFKPPPQFKQPSPPQLSLYDSKSKTTTITSSAKVSAPISSTKKDDMAAEEAANLLLAFSSPDTLRPQQVVVGQRERRLTLDGEDFTLDGGVMGGRRGSDDRANRSSSVETKSMSGGNGLKVGKSARDILRMSEFHR
ncbi:hypothetical protein CI109_104981 [Kwoniella shandongensis]|uniref:Uncharacterized protein n=1 Tax=Kwoniella shandongensis TaxID=1734106 RepID=A0A5M6BSI5_9TREE|nr:uncharacterized protein CI109_006696 [Kwoniella shandongensis]KAA5524972.1 hypothetical protein CI109_006696 [Kwoniella shandongensis]